MTATTHYRSHHQRIADENPDGMLATAMLDAAAYRARYDREIAEYHAAVAAEARDPLGPMPIDPTAGDMRGWTVEYICLRGD